MLRLVRILLFPISFIYLAITKIRNFLYDHDIFRTYNLPVPVISIGNIAAGGTGKTPFSISLTNLLRERGFKPAILTRGYKKQSKGQVLVSKGSNPSVSSKISGDEPYVLARNTQAVVIANPDRYEAGRTAIENYNCDIIIADDAFQHRKLQRDLDILLWDSNHSPQDSFILPTGYLREDIKSVRRADHLVFTRTEKIPDNMLNLFNKLAPDIGKHCAPLKINKLVKAIDQTAIPENIIEGKSILAFCGLGNPSQFFETIKQLKPQKIDTFKFKDHHKYNKKELQRLVNIADSKNHHYLITTEKDFSNFPDNYVPDKRILILKIELAVDPELFNQIINKL